MLRPLTFWKTKTSSKKGPYELLPMLLLLCTYYYCCFIFLCCHYINKKMMIMKGDEDLRNWDWKKKEESKKSIYNDDMYLACGSHAIVGCLVQIIQRSYGDPANWTHICKTLAGKRLRERNSIGVHKREKNRPKNKWQPQGWTWLRDKRGKEEEGKLAGSASKPKKMNDILWCWWYYNSKFEIWSS